MNKICYKIRNIITCIVIIVLSILVPCNVFATEAETTTAIEKTAEKIDAGSVAIRLVVLITVVGLVIFMGKRSKNRK